MTNRQKPTYKLNDVKDAIANNRYMIRKNAQRDALRDFGWTTQNIHAAFLKLNGGHFYKTMKSEIKPGVMLDVYKSNYLGCEFYTHFYMQNGMLVIINSFHKR